MRNILEYFERTAAKFPDKTAIAGDNAELTFAQLLRLSQNGGTAISRRGFRAEPIVVFLPKHPETVAAFFAVVYSGCYYVPIDSGMPLHRIRMILQSLSPRAIICCEETAKITEELGYAAVTILADTLFSETSDLKRLNSIREKSVDVDPVYLLFTSGSTGMPKGVTACHRSIIDYAEAFCSVIKPDEHSVFAMQVPLYVDACLKELLSMICCGSEVRLMQQNLFLNPLKAVGFLNEYKVNTICWVASALTMLSGLGAFEDICPAYLKTVCFGSEVFPVRQLHLWQQACPNARFFNLYGPTETTGMSFWYEVDREFQDGEPIPVGKPFPNIDFFLLSDEGKETEKGNTGEICIRGTCVTMGYYNDPERTSKSFVQNPLNSKWHDIVYLTGDLGYLDKNDDLVFVSRKDNQIKNMGHRVELGEIEQCACCFEGVQNACCLWDAEKKKLILFCMGNPDEKELRKYFRKEMPRHMIPNIFYMLDVLPTLPNGKIDRKTLMEQHKKLMK